MVATNFDRINFMVSFSESTPENPLKNSLPRLKAPAPALQIYSEYETLFEQVFTANGSNWRRSRAGDTRGQLTKIFFSCIMK